MYTLLPPLFGPSIANAQSVALSTQEGQFSIIMDYQYHFVVQMKASFQFLFHHNGHLKRKETKAHYNA